MEKKKIEIAPIRKGHKFIRFNCHGGMKTFEVVKVNKDCSVVLKLGGAEAVPEEERRAVAKEIAKIVEPQVLEYVGQMLEDGLTRKPIETLEKIKDAAEKGVKPKLESKPGCVHLEVGSEITVL